MRFRKRIEAHKTPAHKHSTYANDFIHPYALKTITPAGLPPILANRY
jgi:hypothetical protein